MRDRVRQLALLMAFAGLMLAFGAKDALIRPPSPPAQTAVTDFDSARAAARLARILGDQRAHPVDSAANDAVRGRLMAELRALGLTPQVRERMDCNGTPKSRSVSCSLTRNVVVSIGPPHGRRLLINSHYDSTPTGPGAADDGIGVAAMLEIGAQLRAAPPARPVTLLFNEGEEFGLNGARAFVEGDPLAREVDTQINIEARGVNGPALMFETSDPNGPALADYARATIRPYANSISTDFARLIPNTTDVTVFKERGWKTLSYSIIGNETRYHSPGDTLEALNRASLYHLGSEVLAATKVLAADQVARGEGRRVFTDIAGRGFISLPLIAAALLLAAILGGTALVAYRRKALGRPFGVVAGAVLAAIVATAMLGELAALIRAGDYWRAHPLVAYLAVYATLLAIEAALLVRFTLGIDRERLRIAGWLFIGLVGAVASIALPGATIFFLAPSLLALIAMLIVGKSAPLATALFWAAALLQLLMFAELLALIEMLLIDGPLAAVAPLAALAALPFLIEMMPAERPRIALLTMGVAALGLWIVALAMPRTSAERPGAFTIDYVRDDLRGKSNWAVASKQAPLPGDWNRFGSWHGAKMAYNGRRRWIAEAPVIDIPRPAIRLLSSAADGKGRIVWLMLRRGGGDAIALKFPKDVQLVAMGLPGNARLIPPNAEPSPAFLRCTGRACDRLIVEVRLAGRAKVKAELIGTRFGLPEEGQKLSAARPAQSQPQYAPDSSIRIRGVTF
ncbi:MAG TPA: M20/M25/M40 family metallo-hydrolase [Sphingomicrobium sp.]|nr:M20/M25/M40 family metallo-hydrolase [Sphingomicrobium sp.]